MPGLRRRGPARRARASSVGGVAPLDDRDALGLGRRLDRGAGVVAPHEQHGHAVALAEDGGRDGDEQAGAVGGPGVGGHRAAVASRRPGPRGRLRRWHADGRPWASATKPMPQASSSRVRSNMARPPVLRTAAEVAVSAGISRGEDGVVVSPAGSDSDWGGAIASLSSLPDVVPGEEFEIRSMDFSIRPTACSRSSLLATSVRAMRTAASSRARNSVSAWVRSRGLPVALALGPVAVGLAVLGQEDQRGGVRRLHGEGEGQEDEGVLVEAQPGDGDVDGDPARR